MSEIQTKPAAITIRNLRKAFHGRAVLDGIDLEFSPGSLAALIGPSGGGKSTLLRCLNGLNTFDDGEVSIHGATLGPGSGSAQGDAARAIRRATGMIFQDFQLFPHLTALGNVMEAPVQVLKTSPAQAREQAEGLLQRVGLDSHGHKFPAQLSGGQKQRVAIARALAMKPTVLLCDEITSALDPEVKHEVLEVLEELRGDGLTLIMVTHEIGFARRAADRVVVLDGGKIIEDGPPAQVIDAPQNPRTRQFLSRVMG